MKRLLEVTGDLRLAFWLILAAGAVMWIGSIYSSVNFSLINSMNGVPLSSWFTSKGIANITVTWWIPAMFFVFFLLGINTIACTINRMSGLIPRRKILGREKFLVLISPSVIHILFIIMLAGHFMSFTAIMQEKISVDEGQKIYVSGIGDVTVTSIKNVFFPDSSLLANRIKQTTAAVEINKDGVLHPYSISFMEPVLINGNIIQLDMEKRKENLIVKPLPKDETCNKEKKFHYNGTTGQENPQLYLLVTRDPGLFLLLPGFIIVIIIMGWYFYKTGFAARKSDYREDNITGI